jgi:O-antigen/teichoic acid export membrane protein
MRKGVKAYAVSSVVSQGTALLRFVLLARLLGVQELGLAAMLILTSQFFQAISDTGSDRFLVQDARGDEPTMQGFVQLVLTLRGVLIALALVVFARPAAMLYHEPQLAISLVGLALAPLIGGLVHLDFRRVQRHGDFRPESWGVILSETLSLVASTVAAFVTRDHTAVIYGLVVRSLVLVVVSHITATRPYRWGFDRTEGMRFSAYAAPLFLNGLLLFFGSQGDRLVVGSGLGAAALGYYSAILLLIYYPSGILIRFMAGVSLPQIARVRDDPARYAIETRRFAGRTMLLALGMAVGFALVAPIFTPLFYGKKFAQPLQIFALIGVLQSARYLRVWPTTVANSVGRSPIILYNNIARMIGLPLALGINLLHPSLESIVVGFILGEVAAVLVALWFLARAGTQDLRQELIRVSSFLAGGAVAIAWAFALQLGNLMAMPFIGVATIAVGIFVARSEASVIAELLAIARRRLKLRAPATARPPGSGAGPAE